MQTFQKISSRARRLGGLSLFFGVVGYLSLTLYYLSLENPSYDISHEVAQLIGQQPFPNGHTRRQMLGNRLERVTAENIASSFYVFDERFDPLQPTRIPNPPFHPRVFQGGILSAEQDAAFSRVEASLKTGKAPDLADQAVAPRNSLRLNGVPLVWSVCKPGVPWPGLIDESVTPYFFLNFYTELVDGEETITRLQCSLPFLLFITDTDAETYQTSQQAREQVRQTAAGLERTLRTHVTKAHVPTPTATTWSPAQIHAFYSWVGAAAVVNNCISLRLKNTNTAPEVVAALQNENAIGKKNWTRTLVPQLYPTIAKYFADRQQSLGIQMLGWTVLGLLGMAHYGSRTPRHLLLTHLNPLPNPRRLRRRFIRGALNYSWFFVVPIYKATWLDCKIAAWCKARPEYESRTSWWQRFRARLDAQQLLRRFERVRKHGRSDDKSEVRSLCRKICDANSTTKRDQLRAWRSHLRELVVCLEERAKTIERDRRRPAAPRSITQPATPDGHRNGRCQTPGPTPHYTSNQEMRNQLQDALGTTPRSDLKLTTPNITTLLAAIKLLKAVHPGLVPILHQHPLLPRWLGEHRSHFTQYTNDESVNKLIGLILETENLEVIFVFRSTLLNINATHDEVEGRIRGQLNVLRTFGVCENHIQLLAVDDSTARDRGLMVRQTSTTAWRLAIPTRTNGHSRLWVMATNHYEDDRDFLLKNGVPRDSVFVDIGHRTGEDLLAHLLGGYDNAHRNGHSAT